MITTEQKKVLAKRLNYRWMEGLVSGGRVSKMNGLSTVGPDWDTEKQILELFESLSKEEICLFFDCDIIVKNENLENYAYELLGKFDDEMVFSLFTTMMIPLKYPEVCLSAIASITK